ncbi:MAG TPA: hypothetical protein VJT15_16680 [Pyrinomonadaceae bacterium]|nr:hypothetical protein [Pyrinomonadaceae bacterium]
MGAVPSRKASETAKAKREFKNTPLNDAERQRLHGLTIRFQEVIYDRNKAVKDVYQKEKCDVDDLDFIRAGLLKLEEIAKADVDEFYRCVIRAKKRE